MRGQKNGTKKEDGEDITTATEQPTGFVYPVYDKWEVSIEGLAPENPNNTREKKRVMLTAVKIKRNDVKIEHIVAERLNAQSHNNGVRYYLKGSITNGNEETITIN